MRPLFINQSLGNQSLDPARQESRQLLSALQLADSSFPIGSFAFSHGLESAVERRIALDIGDVVALLESQIRQVMATQDLPIILAVHRLVHNAREDAHGDRLGEVQFDPIMDGIVRLDQMLFARRLVREPREASRRAGRAMLSAAAAFVRSQRFDRFGQLIRLGDTPGLHPVVHGLVTSVLGLPPTTAAMMFAHGFAMSGLSAAVRLLPIAHLDVQRALATLQPVIIDAVEKASTIDPMVDPNQMSSSAPYADLLAIWHERGLARAFAT